MDEISFLVFILYLFGDTFYTSYHEETIMNFNQIYASIIRENSSKTFISMPASAHLAFTFCSCRCDFGLIIYYSNSSPLDGSCESLQTIQ